MFLVFPLVLYIAEKFYRWLFPAVRTTELLDATLVPGSKPLMRLRIMRPDSFTYRRVSAPKTLNIQ